MTTPGILIVFSNQPYIRQIIFSNVFFIQDFQRPLVMNGMTGWKLNSNVKRKDITGKSISIDLQMYKTAIVFGTIDTTSETLLLVTRQYNDVVVVESLHGASKERVTGIVDSKTNSVTLTFPENNSAIIIW